VFWCILVNVSYLLLPSVGQILITQLTDESLCETYSTRAPGCTNTTVMHGNTYVAHGRGARGKGWALTCAAQVLARLVLVHHRLVDPHVRRGR
jgi:hypothetical protein